MPVNFDTIDYLQRGSTIQKRGWRVLTDHRVMQKLVHFHPILAGTLPLDLFIEGVSDLDVLCEANDLESFAKHLQENFSTLPGFSIRHKTLGGIESVIANLTIEDFPLEIVGQPLASRAQVAYRHMVIEYRILQERGDDFKNQVMALKKKGIKTEPAFASLLQLKGDPYKALLLLE